MTILKKVMERRPVMPIPLISRTLSGIIPGRMSFRCVKIIRVFLTVILCLPAISAAATGEEPLSVATKNGLSLGLTHEGRLTSLAIGGHQILARQEPVLRVRDMSSAAQVSSPNLLSNPGFEQGLNGWSPQSVMDTDIGVDSTVSRSGGSSLKMHGLASGRLGAGIVYSGAIPVEPGRLYRISGYFKSSRGYLQGISGIPTAYQDMMWRGILKPNGLYVQWLDAQGAHIDDSPVLAAPVHWDASSWKRISGEVHAPPGAAALQVLVVGRLQDEYMWVDDLCVLESPEKDQPVAGSVIKKDGKLIQTGETGDGTAFTVTYTPMDDHIRIHIEMEDQSNRERALEVSWGLPLVLAAEEDENSAPWRWWDDVHHSRIIHQGPAAAPLPEYPFSECLSWQYEHVVSGVWDGWLPVSLYPYAAVENGQSGLAMAVSLASPRLVKFSYDQTGGRFEARAYLGISPKAAKLHGRADLTLELYPTDPGWGFRSAMDLYAKRHPGWFKSDRDTASFNAYERGFYNTMDQARQVLEFDAQNIFSAEYTVAEAPVDIWPSSMPMPSYDDLLNTVSGLPGPKRDAVCSSIAFGGNGDWQLKHVGDFKWAAGTWRAVWYTSVDPDIDGGWGQYLWEENIRPAIDATEAAGAVLDGVMMDNFLSAPGVDLRDDHLELTDTALTYDIATYRPGIHNMANIFEYFTWLRQRLRERDRDDMAIAINFWSMATANGLVPLIDTFGGEGQSKTDSGSNWTTRILDYRRAMSGKKAMSWANEESGLSTSDVQAYVSRALFYGIYPKRKEEAAGWEPGSEEILKNAQEMFHQYASAGWEPVTYAAPDNGDIWIERFGNLPSEGQGPGLFFTVYNKGDSYCSSSITIESAALGLMDPASARLTDIATGQQIPFSLSGTNIIVSLEMEPQQTRVIQVADGPACSLCSAGSRFSVFIDADPSKGPGPLSPLWRPGIVWEGGGGGGTSINPTLVDYWAGLGGFDRIGLVRIVPELDSMARGAYSLASFAPLAEQVRDHGGRLLVKIKTTPLAYSNTPNPPDACPSSDPSDWRHAYRYNRYGVKRSQEAAYKDLIKDFIRYFSGKTGYVVNPQLFGDSNAHAVLGMPDVLYELWDEPNYDMEWCDTEENFHRLYQIIVDAANEVRHEDLLSFTIGGPGWRKKTLRNPDLPAGFGAPGCLEADDPDCGAVRRFYDFLAGQGYLENGHISCWSYSYLPTEVSEGETGTRLQNIRSILNDPRYQDHYSDTLVILGEWAPPFNNRIFDLLPSKEWIDSGEYGEFFGKNIKDDNEVGASLVPARIWDMTNASPPPSLQSYFQIGEWPTEDILPLFKGTSGIMTAQSTGLIKAVSNVFLMLNHLQSRQLAVRYVQNPMLNLVATASSDGKKLAVLGWYHPNIKVYEENDRVRYDELLDDLEQDGIRPVTVTLKFSDLVPDAGYDQTLYLVDRTHSNAFTYRHEIMDELLADCGDEISQWKRSCIYRSVSFINNWTLDGTGPGASVGMESVGSTLEADDLGNAQITLTAAPYSVFLVVMDRNSAASR